MSTRSRGQSKQLRTPPSSSDPAESVAAIAAAKRELLLRVHRHRLRYEDLEDCYSEATLELVALAKRGRSYAGRIHIARALEQRFLARVQDRRRAIGGRSPIAAAMESALPLVVSPHQQLELPDTRTEPGRLTIGREQLALLLRHMSSLTPDERLVLSTQIALAMRCPEFCRQHSWTAEKYRKVAQRGRAKLRARLAAENFSPSVVPLHPQPSEKRSRTLGYDKNSPHS